MKIKSLSLLFALFVITLLNCKKEEKVYTAKQKTKLEQSINRGSEIYADFCVSCHLPSGEGVKNVYPPLANSDYLKTKRTISIKGVKYGQKGEITVNGVVYNNIIITC